MDTPAEQLLNIGDRIQLIQPMRGVVVGTQGTILRRFTFDPLYDICFDGYPAPRLVNKQDLIAIPLTIGEDSHSTSSTKGHSIVK
jgi:hypothetical protein